MMGDGTAATEWQDPRPKRAGLQTTDEAIRLDPPVGLDELRRWQLKMARSLGGPQGRANLGEQLVIEPRVVRSWSDEQARAVGETVATAEGLKAELMARLLGPLFKTGDATLLGFVQGLSKWPGWRTMLADYLSVEDSSSATERRSQVVGMIASIQVGLKTECNPQRRAILIELLGLYAGVGFVAAFDVLEDHARLANGDERDRSLRGLETAGPRLIARAALDIQSRTHVTVALFDTLFKMGEFERADAALRRLEASSLPNELYLGVLSATKPAARRLRERDSFLKQATSVLRSRAPERADRLLQLVE
jgi:hypothetical protein